MNALLRLHQYENEKRESGVKIIPELHDACFDFALWLENLAAQQSVQRTGGTQIEVSVSCSKCGNQTPFTIEIPASR